jgi:hypothetical protein
MPIPSGLKAIDLMMNIPDGDPSAWYEFIKPLLLDEESRKVFTMPAQYMFKDIPDIGEQKDYVQYAIGEMDKWGIQQAMLGISGPNSTRATSRRAERTLTVSFPPTERIRTTAWRKSGRSESCTRSMVSRP